MRNPIACVAALVTWALLGAAHASGTVWPPPNAPVQIFAPAPGGIQAGLKISRLLAAHMQQHAGGQFSTAADTPAHGLPAAGFVAAAPANGSTLLLQDTSLPTADGGASATLQPVALVARLPGILVVNRDLPVKNLSQFADYVHRHPGEVNFGSIGHGSAMHLAGQLYMQQTGSNMVHVPYTSASLAVSNLISGQIQAMFQVVPAILPQLRTGEVRPLALMNPQRIPALPDVPTADEAGYAPLRSSVWLALMAPAQTPDAVIQHINEALNAALADESVRRGLEDLGAIPGGGSPEEARTVLQQSRIHWQALMREADPPMR
ncbi:tripartite tricarboxylate transporter substrate binding protein [Pusillimonas sp. TS35]|uniref:Bug family tripartite tricarboxylate transporter substrate binding protein n=1 Tax=Paracandidimonas lactea TaxID=2895524 RepID=UPI00136EDC66|nr:tripartite tricarboxylate transporter substrate binding protein [Paracandidimonas lactea]MYN13032.1 tripartite tricarboxylate transporter substrate binding protein [Pusillimonas sp. TS35]